jgi:CO/xanthine dehydrogenase Mo-binding subunit
MRMRSEAATRPCVRGLASASLQDGGGGHQQVPELMIDAIARRIGREPIDVRLGPRIEAEMVDRGDQDWEKGRGFSYRRLGVNIKIKRAQESSQSPQVMFVGESVCSTHSTRATQ